MSVVCIFSGLLFDCGEGTLRQLWCTASVSRGMIDSIFITHLHGDHVYGLPGLLCTLLSRFMSPSCATDSPILHIFGPHGLALYLQQHFGGKNVTSEEDTARKFHVTELLTASQRPSVTQSAQSYFGTFGFRYPDRDGKHTVMSTKDFTVKAAPIRHSRHCYGCVFIFDVGVWFASRMAAVFCRYIVDEHDLPGTIDADKV